MSDHNTSSTEKTSRKTINEIVEELAHEYDPEPRVRALQSLLIEEGLLSTDAVDDVIATYEEDIGPLNGAKVVARAWSDPAYKRRLLDDGMAAIEELDIKVNDDVMEIEVLENTPNTHHIVVCTLCSCYPWAVLGLPPTWYKSDEYRSRVVREPRALLAEEFGVELDEDVEINVWDSTSELRYMVLPQQPPETQDLNETELVEHVTRNAMIGTDRLV